MKDPIEMLAYFVYVADGQVLPLKQYRRMNLERLQYHWSYAMKIADRKDSEK